MCDLFVCSAVVLEVAITKLGHLGVRPTSGVVGGGVADLVRKFVLNSHFLSLCCWLARFHTH